MTSPTPAAQVIISLIPIVGIVMGCVVIFFYLYWNHKQKVLMIEKGIIDSKPFDYRLFSLFVGCVLFGVGGGLTLFFYAKEGIGYSLLGGVVPLSVSVGLLFFFLNYDKFKQMPYDVSDEMIVQDILAGNSNSFIFIIERYQQRIFSMGMRFLKNKDDASDFAQEVFIKVFENLSSYKKKAPFKYWMVKIAYNHGINCAQKKNSTKEPLDTLHCEAASPEKQYIKKEATQALLEAIQKLPEQYQICVDFYFFLGFTYQQIQEITQLPINTIKSHVFRAKQILRQELEKTAAKEYYDEM